MRYLIECRCGASAELAITHPEEDTRVWLGLRFIGMPPKWEYLFDEPRCPDCVATARESVADRLTNMPE